MLDFRHIFGRRGERTAVSFLKKRNCRILEKNYRNRFGEIDIIAKDQGVIVFIEVKTRSGFGFGTPKMAVTSKKRERLSRVALLWLKSKGLLQAKARFDVIAIVANADGEKIEWIQNAFDAHFRF